ncbi:Abi family protein [Enterococcus sp. DIV1271a]|uniref:Abi family protein n=2 Tax=Enterococcus TaxID=1350 RepID=UPI001A9AE01E|nr:Abi family protein [Enterococcus sp. DIV1271a]MBO0461223.1 Abi family protein [Enterococcus sp. DIV1298c]
MMDDKVKQKLFTVKEALEEKGKNEAILRHPKASFEDLIDELVLKGIGFNIMNKSEAKKILSNLNYYYKLTVYRRNFKRDADGKYVNLEFSYLTDLASVDMQLRYILLTATLDIEHAMKTFLITHITENLNEDGYKIVNKFFHSTLTTSYEMNREKILHKIKEKSHYQRKLYEAHKDSLSIWVLVEVMSFGEFTRLFEFYFKKYSITEFEIRRMSGIIHAVKRIRNSCAHNNPLLFYLSRNELEHPNRIISDYCKKAKIGEAFYRCVKVHDIVAVLYAHDFFVKGIGTRKFRHKELLNLTIRSIDRFDYLPKDNDIYYFFRLLRMLLNSYKIE